MSMKKFKAQNLLPMDVHPDMLIEWANTIETHTKKRTKMTRTLRLIGQTLKNTLHWGRCKKCGAILQRNASSYLPVYCPPCYIKYRRTSQIP